MCFGMLMRSGCVPLPSCSAATSCAKIPDVDPQKFPLAPVLDENGNICNATLELPAVLRNALKEGGSIQKALSAYDWHGNILEDVGRLIQGVSTESLNLRVKS